MRLSPKGLKWLKGFHLTVVGCWIGGAFALFFLYFLKGNILSGPELYGINRSAHHIDVWVIIMPGASGCFITGLIYSSMSNWGFFKHGWITYKWIITVTAMLLGAFFLEPWEVNMMNISRELGIGALQDSEYLYNENMNFYFGILQLFILVTTVFISIFKPWNRITQFTK